ncbi:SH3 domain-containing protein [Bacillus cereus]|nr:hypothetical protein [Bacillus cereus]HDR3914623.1 hypothetical protein [Bacillus cereus]HDV7172695.1 hypothetical protein [Bacillus cereus]
MTVSLGRVYIQGTNVNVRKGSDITYSKIAQVNQPETFLVADKENGWLLINGFSASNNKVLNGWIKYDKSYIQFLENGKQSGVATINGMYVNVRKGPNKKYDVVKQVNKTDPITDYQVFEAEDGWLNLGGNQWMYYDPKYIKLKMVH